MATGWLYVLLRVPGTESADGIGEEHIAEALTYAPARQRTHLDGSIVGRRFGSTIPPILQTAVAGIVAWYHRVTEVGSAVGRYTPSVTHIAERAGSAVNLHCNLSGMASSYLASEEGDTVSLVDTQNPQVLALVFQYVFL